VTSSRRDEGADEHPQLKNNAEIAAQAPELLSRSCVSSTNQKPKKRPFAQELLETSLTTLNFLKKSHPLAKP
jgi:hypothetical protein